MSDGKDKLKSIIVNDFTEASANKFREQVLERSGMDSNLPILVYIDSYGGYVDALNSMLATMRQVPNKFVTVCIGKAMSCGAALLAAGDIRYMDEGSRAMIHQSRSGAVGPTESLQNDINENKRLNKQLMDFILNRCNKKLKDFYAELKKKNKPEDQARDLYLSPKEALDFGLIDEVGMPIIKPVVYYSIESVPKKKYEPINKPAKKTVKKKPTRKNIKTTKRSRKK